MRAPQIAVLDIRNALDGIESHAHGAGVDDETERSAHLFHVLEEIRNIRRIIRDIDVARMPCAGESSEFRGMIAATQGLAVDK